MSVLALPARRLSPSPVAAFAGVSVALGAFFFASGAPTPLLVIYQNEWGFGPGVLALAFGVYAFGLLASLLVAGSLSDHLGRKPVLIGSLLLELVAMVMFLLAPGIGWVIAARVVQGFATGAATSAFTAAIVELAPERHKKLGTLIGSVSPAGGLGLGALFAGAVAQFSAHAAAIIWGVLVVVMAAGAAFALSVPETVTPRPGVLASLRPRVSVPAKARSQFGAASIALVGAWMMAALFLGLVPTILGNVFAIHSAFADGATAFIEPAVAAVVAFYAGRLDPRRTLLLGSAAVAIGAAVIVLSVVTTALPLLWLGGAIGGVGFGATLSGAFRALGGAAEAHERAGLFAAIYLVAYLAFGLPAIVAGRLMAPLGLHTVAIGFAAATIIAAAAGLLAVSRVRRQPA